MLINCSNLSWENYGNPIFKKTLSAEVGIAETQGRS